MCEAAAGFTTRQRSRMFYMVCVPLRLSLSAVVYYCGGHSLARSAAVVSGLASFFFNSKKIRDAAPNETWWYRPVHMLAGVSVSLSFVASSNTVVPSAILLVDALVGLATSFYNKPFTE
ncbi:unnamed protein product [Ectocarpus sp. 12 AP-2014]